MTHAFEFSVSAPTQIGSVTEWTDQLRGIEDMSITTVVVADHFNDGYDLEPMVTLTAAAMPTSTLRVQTGVLGNDYRHPVLTARVNSGFAPKDISSPSPMVTALVGR